MTKLTALLAIIAETGKENCTVTGYRQMLRALKALGFNAEDTLTVLYVLEYVHPETREPYKWLADKLAAQK